MSYPSLLPDSDLRDYITLPIPNHNVIRKIIKNSENDEILRLQISPKMLYKMLENTSDGFALLFA